MQNKDAVGRLWGPVLAGAVLGPALQLQQSVLWSFASYAALGLAALAALAWSGSRRRAAVVVVLVALVAFAACGTRASAFAARALDAALEGRDLTVVGTVAAMPQRNELGLRLRFEPESAHDVRGAVRLPSRLSLSWYAGAWAAAGGTFELQRAIPDLRAGERWQLTVRLRAPHGNLNPHGFDYELWLWEQGVQATGYVRAGAADPAPLRLQASWRHPVERARQAIRDAIEARIGDRSSAGIVAALVVGDQAAIDLGRNKSVLTCL